MTGLHFIRTRTNFSSTEIAEILGVSRQAVSAWETGKKAIPAERSKELAAFYGIDSKYFGELTDSMKDEIIGKPMFRYYQKGKQKFLFRPTTEERADGLLNMYFFHEIPISFDDEAAGAERMKNETLNEIAAEIDGPPYLRVYEKERFVKGRCKIYHYITSFLQNMDAVPKISKVSFLHEFMTVLDAMVIAYGIREQQDIMDELPEEDIKFNFVDIDFMHELSAILRTHWERTLHADDTRIPNEEKEKNRNDWKEFKAEQLQKPLEVRIAEAEEVYRRFREEGHTENLLKLMC